MNTHKMDSILNTIDKEENVIEEKKFEIEQNKLFEYAKELYTKSSRIKEIDYNNQVILSAYHNQAVFGPYEEAKSMPLGFFDFVGHDRRNGWIALGVMKKEDAMKEFCKHLRECTQEEFDQHIEASIQSSITNSSTILHEPTEPTEPITPFNSRADLIENMREEHPVSDVELGYSNIGKVTEESDCMNLSILLPKITYISNIEEFKTKCKKLNISPLVVPRGESLTLKTATTIQGSHIVWEIVTDNYDIGIQVLFTWNFLKTSSHHAKEEEESRLMSMEVLPFSIRDTYMRVHCITHKFPCEGIYCLILDNSHSYIRSKTVYYKISVF